MQMARRANILRAVLAVACVGPLALWAGGADGALIKVGGLVLKADGGFRPQRLPRHSYAPVEFQGHADIRSTDGTSPPELTEAIIEFDRNGRLQTQGLQVCAATRIAGLATPAARHRCEGAIVGTGSIGVTLFFEGAGVHAHAPLTLFNGPRVAGNLTVLAHTHIASPVNQTFVVPVTIESRRGEYRYRARFDVPSLAGGGVLTHVDAKVGRRYMYHGVERSYASARCSDGIFRTHGHFVFDNGVIIDGAIEKPCTPAEF
jgi:hypothetical protein